MNLLNVPSLGWLYGPIGCGKTVAVGRFGPRWRYVGIPGKLRCIQMVWGFEPDVRPAETIWQAVHHVRDVANMPVGKRPDGVVVDEASYLAERSEDYWETAQNPELKIAGRTYKANVTPAGYELPKAVRNELLELRDVARSAGLHVWVTSWERSKHIKKANQQMVAGGPMLQSDLPEKIPGMFDFVGKVELPANPSRIEDAGHWPACVRMYLHGDWVMRDADEMCPDCSPVNIPEMMRSVGYKLDRGPLERYEGQVQKVADFMYTSGPDADDAIYWSFRDSLMSEQKLIRQHASWLASDAWDRARLWRAREQRWRITRPIGQ